MVVIDREYLAKRSTNELKKLLKDEQVAENKWKEVKQSTERLHGADAAMLKTIDRTIDLHRKKIILITDFITKRTLSEDLAKLKKKKAKK